MESDSIRRVLKTINFEKPDRLPVYEWFWPEFMERWEKEKGRNLDIYDYYDIDIRPVGLDYSPNPGNFKILEKTENHVLFQNGWGMIIKKVKGAPMNQFIKFPIKEEKDFAK